MSRNEIRQYTNKIRGLIGLKSDEFVNAPKLYDTLSVLFSNHGLDFDYTVLPDNDEIFIDKEEAFTNVVTGKIYIKESVMNRACNNSYDRGAFTLIHELGHFFLHYIQLDAKLCRVEDEIDVPAYRDPEWQANAFASEFLMPFVACIDMTPDEIRNTFHVSKKAATIRASEIREEIYGFVDE